MNAPRMANQVLDNVAEIAEKAKDLSAKVKDRLDETYMIWIALSGGQRPRRKTGWMTFVIM